MKLRVPDIVVAPALALLAVALYLGSALGRGASESGQAALAAAILAGRLPPTQVPVPPLFVVPFLVAVDAAYAQAIAAAVAGGVSAGAAYLVLRRIGAPATVALTVTTFSIAGTALWFNSVDARDASLAQCVAVLLSTLALLAAIDGRPAWLAGFLLAAAALSRPPVALAAAGLAVLSTLYRQRPLAKSVVLTALGLLPFVAIAAPFAPSWYEAVAGGALSLANLPRHLYAVAMQAPEYVGDGLLFVRPLAIGTSLLLTSPALVYAVAALRYLPGLAEVRALALAATLPLLLDVLQQDVGSPQFGYRLALDAQPFLLPLVALGGAWDGAAWGRMRWPFVATVLWSVAANLYGVVTILHLGLAR